MLPIGARRLIGKPPDNGVLIQRIVSRIRGTWRGIEVWQKYQKSSIVIQYHRWMM